MGLAFHRLFYYKHEGYQKMLVRASFRTNQRNQFFRQLMWTCGTLPQMTFWIKEFTEMQGETGKNRGQDAVETTN